MTLPTEEETRAVVARYARRAPADERYDPLRPEVWQARQERQRALVTLLRRHAEAEPKAISLLEVGCGHGDNLLELLGLGFDPARLVANELLPLRVAVARQRLPAAIPVIEGDALQMDWPEGRFDVVLQSTVFSSLLDDGFQHRLAEAMWRWTRPGGAVLWYDFTWDNPRNPDVRGVGLARLRRLFPQGTIDARRVTLAPPLARRVVRLHPAAYRVLGSLPWLRTHLLCWIAKPR